MYFGLLLLLLPCSSVTVLAHFFPPVFFGFPLFLASPQASEYFLSAQSPHSDYKILSDALASPNQVIASESRTAPSSREWYSRGLLGGTDGDLPFFNVLSPSSGTRGAVKRRNTGSSSGSRGSGVEIGIGLFGDSAERGLREGDIFSPKLLHSPNGMSGLPPLRRDTVGRPHGGMGDSVQRGEL